MKSIVLSRGTLTWVDDEDYDHLRETYNWWLHKDDSHPKGYAQGQHKDTGKIVYAHRVIAQRLGWNIEGFVVDHRNLDSLWNIRSNLRLATYSQSQHNKRMSRNNTSGHKGVSWSKHTKRWVVQVHRNRTSFARFLVNDFAIACDAADMLRKVAHGEFANLQ